MRKPKYGKEGLIAAAVFSALFLHPVPAAAEEKVVEIPVLLRMDPQTNEANNLALVNAFNEEYEGKYHVDVQWLVETEAGYRNKIKQLNATDKLPAVITDIGFDDKFLQLLIENDRLVNLEPYMEASPEWKAAIREDILEGMKEEDQAVYVSPLGNLMYSSAGIVYNRELLQQAGYDSVPDDWDGFFVCLQKLQDKGITPLALHGAGNYWVPMLFSTAYCSREQEGKAFLSEKFPASYENEVMESMLGFMKKLYTYSYEDALDIEYAEAEKRFFAEEAAIIANGSWMFMGLDEEEKEKYDFASFPGGMLVGSWEMTAWAAVKEQPEEVREGAVEFLKFRTLKDQRDVEKDLENAENRGDIMSVYKEQVWNVEELVPNYQINWEQEIINDVLTTYIPQLVRGQITTKECLHIMDETIRSTDGGQ